VACEAAALWFSARLPISINLAYRLSPTQRQERVVP
jgi:hypothetical protein